MPGSQANYYNISEIGWLKFPTSTIVFDEILFLD